MVRLGAAALLVALYAALLVYWCVSSQAVVMRAAGLAVSLVCLAAVVAILKDIRLCDRMDYDDTVGDREGYR